MNWAIKYRPTQYNQLALKPETKKIIDKIISEGEMGNFLFTSPEPGVGKTSLARILPELLNYDILFINASENGNMDLIKGEIKDFMNFSSFPKKGKVIILDEADEISVKAQASLRGIIEDIKSKKINFIFTCNNKSKIINPISESRLFEINFSLPPISNSEEFKNNIFVPIFNFLSYILKEEKVTFNSKDLMDFIKSKYQIQRDVRYIVNQLQYSVFNKEFKLDIKMKIDSNIFINDIKLKDDFEIYEFSEKEYKNANFYIIQLEKEIKSNLRVHFREILFLINEFQINQSKNLYLEKVNFSVFLIKLKDILKKD